MKILVFPANMAEAQSFALNAQKRGDFLVGASSVSDECAGPGCYYAAWEYLPFVTEADFVDRLDAVVRAHGVEGIYTPHPVVWQKLEGMLGERLSGIALLNAHPVDEALAPYRNAARQAREVTWTLIGLECATKLPPDWLKTGLLHATNCIPGQSAVPKLALMASLVLSAPKGDIIEIGSLWGRSAYVLALAAQHADSGPVICVEPWQDAAYAQPGSSPMLASAAARFNAEEAYGCFLAHLAPFAGTRCNYLRMPAAAAAAVYASQREVVTETYGATPISGRIALLYIDGNHDLAAVREDLALWTTKLMPGGWIVLDDYRWAFGDGPQRAGDEWLNANLSKADVAFAVFDSLWIRMRA